MLELRPHQIETKRRLQERLDVGAKRIVLQAPVAFGKTALAADIIQDNLDRKQRSIFCVPALSLIDQTVERFYQYGIRDVGVMQANHPMTNFSRPVQVCSVQTLARRKTPDADMVIWDECHMQFQNMHSWMADPAWAKVPFVGLTATPWAKGMGKHWDELLVAARMEDMHDQGWLKKLRYFAPVQIDTKGIKMVAGDYHEGQLSERSRGKGILANTVNAWLETARDRSTIAFCVDRAHAQDMQARFSEAGVPCDYIDANTDAEERTAIGKRMEAGHTKVTVSVGCLIAGLDWTFVSCVLFARKTMSPMLWVQAIGRGMRLHPGQADCLLLDCAGNGELGHPFDLLWDSLDDGTKPISAVRKEKQKEVEAAKKCISCGAMRQPKVKACPECGFVPRPVSTVQEQDARVQEVLRDKSRIPLTLEDMQLWYGSLLAIQRDRGYKDSWADVQFKKKFDKWPSKTGVRRVARAQPDALVSNWARAQAIKYAKSQVRKAGFTDQSRPSIYR